MARSPGLNPDAEWLEPDVEHPNGRRHLARCKRTPWPAWTYALPNGTEVEQEIFVDRPGCETVLRWSRSGGRGVHRLSVRPFMSGRDYHALHGENAAFEFAGVARGGNVAWRPYRGLPAAAALTNGAYTAAPECYRGSFYEAERERGLDGAEDLAAPGVFEWDLGAGEAALRAPAGIAAYAAAKSCLLRFMESAAEESKQEGVRVNAVLPAVIDTPPNCADTPGADHAAWTTPREVAEAAAFLLSEAANGVTGALVPVVGQS